MYGTVLYLVFLLTVQIGGYTGNTTSMYGIQKIIKKIYISNDFYLPSRHLVERGGGGGVGKHSVATTSGAFFEP